MFMLGRVWNLNVIKLVSVQRFYSLIIYHFLFRLRLFSLNQFYQSVRCKEVISKMISEKRTIIDRNTFKYSVLILSFDS